MDALQEELLSLGGGPDEHQLQVISTGDLVYDKWSKKWVQRSLRNKKIHTLPLLLEMCKQSLNSFKMAGVRQTEKLYDVLMEGIADTGCSIMCLGLHMCHKFGVKQSGLLKTNVSLKVADGRALTVLGALPVNISN